MRLEDNDDDDCLHTFRIDDDDADEMTVDIARICPNGLLCISYIHIYVYIYVLSRSPCMFTDEGIRKYINNTIVVERGTSLRR